MRSSIQIEKKEYVRFGHAAVEEEHVERKDHLREENRRVVVATELERMRRCVRIRVVVHIREDLQEKAFQPRRISTESQHLGIGFFVNQAMH